MPIALIVAAAGQSQVIGKANDLPWHFSCDLKFFKEKTTGQTLLMGRATYQSILARLGKPLPNRKTIVLTRDPAFVDDRVKIITDLTQIKTLVPENETLFITGGASVYAATMALADTLYLTHIDQEFDGDAYFPPLDPTLWHKESETPITENGTILRFCTYQRIRPT